MSPAAGSQLAGHRYRTVIESLNNGEFAFFSKKNKKFALGPPRRMWDIKRLPANRHPAACLKHLPRYQPILQDNRDCSIFDMYFLALHPAKFEALPSRLAIAPTKAVDFFPQTRTFEMCKDDDIRKRRSSAVEWTIKINLVAGTLAPACKTQDPG